MRDPFAVLGLRRGATLAEVHEARRRLAKLHHPDVGGDAEQMQLVNEAVAAVTVATGASAADRQARTPGGPYGARDEASFVVEALPAEAFEALVVVTSWIGELVSDDPPYVLEAHLDEPVSCWCRLELVPDAGASTVAVTVVPAGGRGHGTDPTALVDLVRDTWVAQLNQLDWDELGRGELHRDRARPDGLRRPS